MIKNMIVPKMLPEILKQSQDFLLPVYTKKKQGVFYSTLKYGCYYVLIVFWTEIIGWPFYQPTHEIHEK